jgi:hypothetical protein
METILDTLNRDYLKVLVTRAANAGEFIWQTAHLNNAIGKFAFILEKRG